MFGIGWLNRKEGSFLFPAVTTLPDLCFTKFSGVVGLFGVFWACWGRTELHLVPEVEIFVVSGISLMFLVSPLTWMIFLVVVAVGAITFSGMRLVDTVVRVILAVCDSMEGWGSGFEFGI